MIIPNYNYSAYLRQAVQSALDLDWPRVEVVVVDDGSTDDSLAVLDEFGDRITVFRQRNSGPRVACNIGFAATHGDWVVFLDSDDVLDARLMRYVEGSWYSGVSKVQVQMKMIDASGRQTGRIFPRYGRRITPKMVREKLLQTSEYPTPPGSGNVYSRSFLNCIFPLDDRCGDAADSACLAAAPVLGDVVSIPAALVSYRVHGANRSSIRAKPARISAQIKRAVARQKFALELAESADSELLSSLRLSSHLLQMRVAEWKIRNSQQSSTLAGESLLRLYADSFRQLVPALRFQEGGIRSVLVLLWCILTLSSPKTAAQHLVRLRLR